MKQLDEMERMADTLANRFDDFNGYFSDACVDLARAFLAVMPTIRAVLDWRERAYPRARSWVVGSRDTDLVSAIDEMRRRLGGE